MRRADVDDRLATTRGIDALVAMGYDTEEVGRILERWSTWLDWSSASWEERARALGHRGHVHIPPSIPEMRGASFGEVVSFVDHGWPEKLRGAGEDFSIIETSGVLPAPAVAVIGSEWPSARGIAVGRELAMVAAGYGFAVVSVERGVGREALRAARRSGTAVSVLYGDSGIPTMRGCVGGVRARIEAAGSNGVLHIRGSGCGADGLRAGTRAVVALAEAVYVVEGGTGRSPGVEAEQAATEQGKSCIWVKGGQGRGEWSRSGEIGLEDALNNLKELAKRL